MNKYFNCERVIEPVGVIPTMAWKLDNKPEIGDKEMLIKLERIKIEEANFRQICNECDYNLLAIKRKIFDIVDKRGKFHNPVTNSGGICCGTIEKIGMNFENNGPKFVVGEDVICLTSLAGLPLYIDNIFDVDFNYAQIEVSGYVIVSGNISIVRKPHNKKITYFLSAMDEVSALRKAALVLQNANRVLILGNDVFNILLYTIVAREVIGEKGYIAIVINKDFNGSIEKETIDHLLGKYANQIYYIDILSSMENFELLGNQERVPFDASIITANMLGCEVLSVMFTKNKGSLYFASLINNYTMAVLCADYMGKELNVIPIEEYSDEYIEFTLSFLDEYSDDLEELDKILIKSERANQTPLSASDLLTQQKSKNYEDFIYSSDKMQKLLDEVIDIASYDCNVLIMGESGVGKEKIMSLLYQNSKRRLEPCIKINCAAIHENLAESEFFGFESGSFTGANPHGGKGYFEIANQGILFLDEITELPMSLQSKLLRVLQENQFYKVGGKKPIKVDVRVICATNVDIRELVKKGKFREDLYYRLCVCEIAVPPLRERQEDIIVLANHFLKSCNKKYEQNKSFSEEAQHILYSYTWPGNVRELSNVIQRVVIASKEEVISGNTVRLALEKNIYGENFINNSELSFKQKGQLKKEMEMIESTMIKDALLKYKTTRAAAKSLGISQSQLMRKKTKYKL